MSEGVIDISPRTVTSRNGGRSTADRLDGFEVELNQLAEGVGAVAEAIDVQALALVERMDDLGCRLAQVAGQLDVIEQTVNGSALALALMEPAVTDSLGIVTAAQKVGWRRAWRARRRSAVS